jgi:hypothetical protein
MFGLDGQLAVRRLVMATLRQDFRTVASILNGVNPNLVFGDPDEDNFRRMLLAARDIVPNDKDILRLLLVHTIDRKIGDSKIGGVSLQHTDFPMTSRLVCQIKGANAAAGTGFLVGPDLILTAAHVLRPGGVWLPPETVLVSFDVLVWRDSKVATRVECGLSLDGPYPIAFSLGPSGAGVRATENELDYALIRIGPAVGAAPLSAVPDAPRRSWFDGSFDPGIPVFDLVSILQHPNGQLLKVAAGSIVRLDANSTRMRYGTSTEIGSSGAPVLDRNQKLIGMHVLSYEVIGDTLIANQGVLFSAIFADLARQQVPGLPAP